MTARRRILQAFMLLLLEESKVNLLFMVIPLGKGISEESFEMLYLRRR
jgi:hypothetical protein